MEQLMKQMETVKSDGGMHWEMVKLSEVCDVLGGYAFKSENFKNEGIPLLRISNIIDGEVSFKEDCVCVEDSNLSILQRFKVIKGDILLALSGATTGKFGVYKLNDFSFLNQRVGLIRAKDKTDPKYLLYYLNILKSQIEQIAQGAAQPNISTNEIGNLQIPLPPLPIQKRIAEILDAADALKRKDQELLKKYDELAQAIFIDMFGDPLKNEKGWEVKKLKEISTKIHSGNTPKGGSNVYVKEGITFFRSQNVWKNNLVYDDIAFIDNKTHLTMMKSSLNHKDILMTKTGRINTENSSLGRAALFLGNDNTANVNGHVYLIRLQNTQVHEFVLHILTTKEYRGLIRDICVGGIDKRQLNKDHIEDFPIIYPPLVTQQKFADLLSFIKKQKQRSEVSAKKSEAIFSTIIQKAFKGELVA